MQVTCVVAPFACTTSFISLSFGICAVHLSSRRDRRLLPRSRSRVVEDLETLLADAHVAVLHEPEDDVDERRIPLPAATGRQLLDDPRCVERTLVEAPRRHRFDRIGDADDPGEERCLLVREAVRVALSVPALVVVA